MPHLIGDVEMQGTDTVDSNNVLHLNDFRPCAMNAGCTDGGKARILRRRALRMRIEAQAKRDVCDDLAMDHADTGDTRPSELA